MREKGCGEQREHRPMRGDLKVRVRFYEFRLKACAFLHRHIQTSRRTAGEPDTNDHLIQAALRFQALPPKFCESIHI